MMKKLMAALLCTTLILPACANTNQSMGQKETLGGLGGAVLGGLLGSRIGSGEGQLWATGAGVLLGAVLGSQVGRSMDLADRGMMERTTQASLEHTRTGATSAWTNPDSGHRGTVTPTRTYQRADGTYCREYSQTVNIDGQLQKATGTACRQPDGTWRLVD